MKTLTLEADYDFDFGLYGLVASLRDYTLAWHLNRALRLRLKRQPDLVLPLLAQGPLTFSYYLHDTEALTLRLLRNRAVLLSAWAKPYLVPELPEYDYLLHVQGGTGNWAGTELLDRLTALPVVQYASELVPQDLKYKENFFF